MTAAAYQARPMSAPMTEKDMAMRTHPTAGMKSTSSPIIQLASATSTMPPMHVVQMDHTCRSMKERTPAASLRCSQKMDTRLMGMMAAHSSDEGPGRAVALLETARACRESPPSW